MPDPENPNPDGGNGPENSGSIVNSDGTFVENWASKYPEEHRATLSRFNKFDDFVASHMSLRTKFGHDPDTMIQIPKDDSSDETKAAFHRAAGKPDAVEGYEFKKATDVSEKVDITDAQIKAFADISHKHNLSKAQFNGVVNDYLMMIGGDIDTFENSQAEAVLEAQKEGNAVLNKIFRQDAPNRKNRANAVFDKYGLEVVKMPDGSETTIKGMLLEQNPNLLQSPWMIMLLDQIAGAMSEDTLIGLGPTTAPTTGQIESKIAEIRAHPGYLDDKHPQHKKLQEDMHELYRKKTPQKQPA